MWINPQDVLESVLQGALADAQQLAHILDAGDFFAVFAQVGAGLAHQLARVGAAERWGECVVLRQQCEQRCMHALAQGFLRLGVP